MKRSILILIVFAFLIPAAHGQNDSVVDSAHNLSASGPGSIRATAEQEVCIFCHTPHNASPIQPLWNRAEPVNAYIVYSSNSLDASPGQPTGSSKLCLSCHDGTIALGSIVSRGQPISMAGGITTLPPGQSNLGTDLSDDHPISFRYTPNLSTKDTKIKSPDQLPIETRLDHNEEMQCTTCHDAHNNRNGKFLVMANENSQLCNTCHMQGTTTIASHTECASCHQPHSAPSGPYLLKATNVTQTCNTCHDGSVTGAENIVADMSKVSRHDTDSPIDLVDHEPTNIVCNDCHEAHTMRDQEAGEPPLISPKLGRIAGVNDAGVRVEPASFEYEVCFKCHADDSPESPLISRVVVQNNTRLEFAANAASSHPVTTAGHNNDVPSLIPTMNEATQIACTSCHGSDASDTAGPHASNNTPLLVARYETADQTSESAVSYALCYRCHERNSILSDESFPLHSKHIVETNTPCSACHDSHGISSAQGTTTTNAHLMNFDTGIVQPDPVTGRLEYNRKGTRTGRCYLTCHGVPHSPKEY